MLLLLGRALTAWLHLYCKSNQEITPEIAKLVRAFLFILDRLRPLPTYAPAGPHACGCGWGVVQIHYLYWLVGVRADVCVRGLCLPNGGLAPV